MGISSICKKIGHLILLTIVIPPRRDWINDHIFLLSYLTMSVNVSELLQLIEIIDIY